MAISIVRNVEFRSTAPEEGGDGRTLEGHAAVFNQPTEIRNWEGHFHEQIAPGAFKKTLRDKTPIIQYDHGQDARVGTVPIAQLVHAKEDGKGLAVKARMYDNPVVEPIRQAIAGGSIDGMSFRFEPVRDSWTDAQGNDVQPEELESLLYGGRAADAHRVPLNRTLREVKVSEMGPVSRPAYEGTDVGVRSMGVPGEMTREALLAEYKRTMVPASEPDPIEGDVRSSGDGDGDVDDFDHFDSDFPVRDDGLPDVADDDKRKAKDPMKPYGDVKYADSGYQADGKKRYPLDTKAHVVSAAQYIAVQANADKYSAADLKKVKAAIAAAEKEFGIGSGKSEKKSAETSGEARSAAPGPESTTPEAASGQDDNKTRKVARTPMNTQAEFEARNAEIVARLQEIGEATRGEALDDAAQEEWDGLRNERGANELAIRRMVEREEELRSLASDPGRRESGASQAGAPAFHRSRDPFDLAAIRSEANGSEERYRDLLVDNASRALEKAKFPRAPKSYKGPQSGDVVTELLETVDRPDVLAMRMLLTGTQVYERAFGKALAAGRLDMLEDEEKRALIGAQNEMNRAQALNTDSAGGFAVPVQLDPTIILTSAGVVNPLRQLARVETITGKVWQGVTSAGVSVSRGTEASTAPDSSFTLAQPTLTTNRVQGFVPFSFEIDMSWGALRAEITKLLIDAKGREEAASFLTGNGTGVQPFGLLGTSGFNTVPTVGAGAFAAADVYALVNAIDSRWEDNASFLANKAIYNKIRQFDTAGGAELWARIGDGQPPRLLDFPDYRSSQMTGTVATGNNIMVLGDFEQFLIVDRLGMNVELIPNLFDPANANRPTGQRGVFAIWMNNSKRLVDTAFEVLVVA